jgi:hypothetical protein
MKMRNTLSRYGICVIASVPNVGDWDPAVPDPARLVTEKIEAKLENRVHQIGGGKQQ